MELIDCALRYVLSGFPVIPLCYPSNGACGCGRNHQDRAIGKVPLTPNGLKDAALSADKVKEYWGRWTKANIGIVIPSGYFVLDIDIEHNGFDSLGHLQNRHNFDLLPTWMVTTGSGGQHYWYKTDKPIKNTARLGGYEGLDIRGLGGYVVAPNSRHRSGHCYETSPGWDGPIVMAPANLIELCLKPLDTTRQNSTLLDTARHYLEGERNDRLSRDAGAMRRRGLSEQAIYAALQVVNSEQCQPPLPDKEVLGIARSIGRYTPTEPKRRMGVSL